MDVVELLANFQEMEEEAEEREEARAREHAEREERRHREAVERQERFYREMRERERSCSQRGALLGSLRKTVTKIIII